MIINKKQTEAAIKAAVNQAKEVKKRYEIKNEDEFNKLKKWVQKKEKQWLK